MEQFARLPDRTVSTSLQSGAVGGRGLDQPERDRDAAARGRRRSDVYHHRSTENWVCRPQDLFAWGTFRKHERNDTAWLDVLQSKVRYDGRYL